MRHAAALAPVFILIALTFGLLIAQGRARIAVLKARQLRLADIALGQTVWPARATQLNRAYQNQFELPLLFYALVALTTIANLDNALFVAMEWFFVVLRLAHAYVHVTSNDVRRRFALFIMGMALLAAMWVLFAARVIFAA